MSAEKQASNYCPSISLTESSLVILKRAEDSSKEQKVAEIDLDFKERNPRENDDIFIPKGLYEAGLEGILPPEEVPGLIEASRALYLKMLRFA